MFILDTHALGIYTVSVLSPLSRKGCISAYLVAGETVAGWKLHSPVGACNILSVLYFLIIARNKLMASSGVK